MEKNITKNKIISDKVFCIHDLLALLSVDDRNNVLKDTYDPNGIIFIEHIDFSWCDFNIDVGLNRYAIEFKDCKFIHASFNCKNVKSLYFKNDKFETCSFDIEADLLRFNDCDFISNSAGTSSSWIVGSSCINELGFFECELKYLSILPSVDETLVTRVLNYRPKGNSNSKTFKEDYIITELCPLKCPEEGSFIGWKKISVPIKKNPGPYDYTDALCKLEIPSDALRSSASNTMCRANKAKVLDITGISYRYCPPEKYKENNRKKYKFGHSKFYPEFEYEVGKVVECCEEFDKNRFKPSATGIHFFISKQEALNY